MKSIICITAVILAITSIAHTVSGADLRRDSDHSGRPLKQANLIGTLQAGDIPLAFQDSPPPSSASTNGTRKANASSRGRSPFKACRNGSGGICVGQDMCPQGYEGPPTGCESGMECCYTTPSGSSCESRGGSCEDPNECGRAVTLKGTDCEENGNVCCILL